MNIIRSYLALILALFQYNPQDNYLDETTPLKDWGNKIINTNTPIPSRHWWAIVDVVNLPRVEPWPSPSERSVLDLDRGGEPLYFRPMHGGVQTGNLSRASAQVRSNSPRFAFVPSLFLFLFIFFNLKSHHDIIQFKNEYRMIKKSHQASNANG